MTSEKIQPSVSINPLKIAPGLGASYAAQGFYKAMPFFHSAPGCSFLSKVLLTQHFMEPIATSGSDIKESALIFGGTRELEVAVIKFCQKSNPEMVFILSSSIPEIRGELYESCIENVEKQFPDIKFIQVNTPDFNGSFSEGFSSLVYASLLKLTEGGSRIEEQVNLLPAPYMTAGDIDELREIIESFGLSVIVIPDLSCGPDGSKEKFSSMSVQGSSYKHIRDAGRSVATISIGESMKSSGEFLQDKFRVRHIHYKTVYGLYQTDEFLRSLNQIKPGTEIALKYKKQRARLKDMMIDTHLILNNKNVAIALEYDHAEAFIAIFKEIGIQRESAISPLIPRVYNEEQEIQQGSLYDIEERIKGGSLFDAMIANTHGKELSLNYGIPLIRAGFPVTDVYGYNYKTSVGYEGATNIISELANVMKESI